MIVVLPCVHHPRRRTVWGGDTYVVANTMAVVNRSPWERTSRRGGHLARRALFFALIVFFTTMRVAAHTDALPQGSGQVTARAPPAVAKHATGKVSFDSNEFFVQPLALSPSTSPLNVEVDQLRHLVWTGKDGAPPGVVTSVVQTPDNFMWLGTENGLYRFDGINFDRSVSKKLPNLNIFSLFAESDGSIWIGYTFGGISRLHGHEITNYDTHLVPAGSISKFARAPNGHLYASTTCCLLELVGNQWQPLSPDSGYSGNHPLWMGIRQNLFWVIDSDGSYVVKADSSRFDKVSLDRAMLVKFGLPDNETLPADYSDDVTLVDSSGAFWFEDLKKGMRRYRWRPTAQGKLAPVKEASSDGGHGVTYYFPDREGSIWAFTSQGVEQFSRAKFTPLLVPSDFIWPAIVSGDHGDIWIGNYDDDTFHVEETTSRYPALGKGVRCATRDWSGAIWTAGMDGLRSLSHGIVTTVPLPKVTQNHAVNCQSVGGDIASGLWISIAGLGLYEFKNDIWTEYGGRSDLPTIPPIRILGDDSHRVWFTYLDNRIAVLDRGNLKVYTKKDGLAVGNVLGLFVHGNHVWATGDKGVAYLFDGQFRTLRGLGGRGFNGTSGVVETEDGELWLNSLNGVFRITAGELRKSRLDVGYEVKYELFDQQDGLPSGLAPLIRPGPSMIQGSDGRIWIATVRGVAWIDPKHILRNDVLPVVSMQSITVEGVAYAPASLVKLPKLTRSLRIDYAAASFVRPDRMHFRYRLDGVDDGWQDVGSRRSAYYTNLRPGVYHFSVEAANEDGLESLEPGEVDFNIGSAFYQTAWFKILCGLMTVAVLWPLFNRNVRISRDRLRARLHERHAERERIARELHDTVLQNFQWLALKLKLWAESQELSDVHREDLACTALIANRSLIEVREKIVTIRRSDADCVYLADVLNMFGDEVTKSSKLKFSLVVDGRPRRLANEAYEAILDVGREGIRNAFLHADATEIHVVIAYSGRMLCLMILDDGHGIDEEVVRKRQGEGHWGIVGQRERAKLLSAHLMIQRRELRGTRVSLEVPARIAYKNTRANVLKRLGER